MAQGMKMHTRQVQRHAGIPPPQGELAGTDNRPVGSVNTRVSASGLPKRDGALAMLGLGHPLEPQHAPSGLPERALDTQHRLVQVDIGEPERQDLGERNQPVE
jgi:hypothetical protein